MVQIQYISIVCALIVVGGCSSFQKSQIDHVSLTSQSQTWSSQENAVKALYLSDLVSTDALNKLVVRALEHNAELNQSLLSLQIVQQQYLQAKSQYLPVADLNLSAAQTQNAGRTYSGGLSISWVLDVWGQVSDQVSSAERTFSQQQALYQQAQDTIAAEVMQSWLAFISLNHQMEIGDARLHVLQQNEKLIYQRYRAGLGTLEDLDAARTSMASALAAQEIRQENSAQQQRVLNVLVGQVTGEYSASAEFPEVLIPLANLPEQNLARRPDLQAAWHAVEAASYERDAAYKDMLPSIALQASYAGAGTTPSKALFENPLWSLLGQLSAPLFQGGALKTAAEIAQLEEAKVYQAYRQTLLTAVQEVENALGQERSLSIQITHIKNALNSADSNLKQYQMKYRSGLATLLELLSVQQQTFDLQSQLDELIYARLSNRITLGLALGLGVKHES